MIPAYSTAVYLIPPSPAPRGNILEREAGKTLETWSDIRHPRSLPRLPKQQWYRGRGDSPVESQGGSFSDCHSCYVVGGGIL